jgi:hypothetical protein
VDFDHPFRDEGVTVNAVDLLADPSTFGLGFRPVLPTLSGGKLRWVDVSKGGTVAFMFDLGPVKEGSRSR